MLIETRLKELLKYNEDIGEFTWIKSTSRRVKIGNKAGCLSTQDPKRAYWVIRLDDRLYPAHRLAWLYMTGNFPDNFIDHINCNKLDNRWINLREVTKAQNMCNTTIREDNTSGIKGLTYTKNNSLHCHVRHNGIIRQKTFTAYKEQEAEEWIRITREELHEEYTNHG